jgi:zinc protease
VFPIRYETTSAIAAALANLVIFGLAPDYFDTYRDHVRGVTTADVLEAARAHLHPDDMRIVVVGDPSVIVDQLADVTGMTIDVARADEEP